MAVGRAEPGQGGRTSVTRSEVVLKTYAHFLSDDDRARAIMDLFFEPGSSAPDVPRAVR